MFNDSNSKMFSPEIIDREKIIRLLEKEIENLYNLGFTWKEDRNIAILNSRFKEGLKCPECGNTNLNKNGKSNGRQRYICKK